MALRVDGWETELPAWIPLVDWDGSMWPASWSRAPIGEAGGGCGVDDDDDDDGTKGFESGMETAGLSDFSGPWPGEEEAMDVDVG